MRALKSRWSWMVFLGFVVSLFLAATPSPGQLQTFRLQSESLVVGASELLASPGVGSGYMEWTDASTFYNTTVTKVGSWYYLWAQTGWDAAGCRTSQKGLDNIVVFKSQFPDRGFHPRGCVNSTCGGKINPFEMRASLATDSKASNQCDPNYRWGLGDVIPYSGSQYLATYDLSKQGLEEGDEAKFHFTLSASNGIDRTSPMYLFAETNAKQNPRKIIIDPVSFKIDSNTVGILFRHANTDFSGGGTGFMVIDFINYPSQFTVRVLDSSGTYRTLGQKRQIDFQFGNIGSPGEINRVAWIDGNWTAFYSAWRNGEANTNTCYGVQSQGSFLGYRPFKISSSGEFANWTGTAGSVQRSDGTRKEWDFLVGLMFPSFLFDPDGSIHLYFTQDNQCKGGSAPFQSLDIMYAKWESVVPTPPSGTVKVSDTFSGASSGTGLNGRTTPVGWKTWVANSNAFFGLGYITGTGNPMGTVAYNPGNNPAIVKAKLDPRGASWMAAGFSEHSSWGWWVDGQVWVLLRPSGTFDILCEGTRNVLGGSRAIPGYASGQYVDTVLLYNPATRKVELWLNGQQAVSPVSLPSACTPTIRYAGFHGLSVTPNQSRVDNFVVEEQ